MDPTYISQTFCRVSRDLTMQMPALTRIIQTSAPKKTYRIEKPRVMVSHQQKEIIVRAMEMDQDLFKARNNSIDGRILYKTKWDRLSRTLNIVQGGARKTISGWQKSWCTLKCSVKTHAITAKDGIPLTDLEKRIAKLLKLGNFSETKEITKKSSNGHVSPTYSDDFEFSMVKIEPPTTSIFQNKHQNPLETNDNDVDEDSSPTNQEQEYQFETINLEPIDQDLDNDITDNTVNQSTDNTKTQEAIDLIANLLERQTSALERQTEALVRKPTPPAPESNINVGINIIGQLLERQTKAIERQTAVIERQAKPNLHWGDGDGRLQIMCGLLERQTKATETLTVAVEKQTAAMERFHGMMQRFLGNMAEFVQEK